MASLNYLFCRSRELLRQFTFKFSNFICKVQWNLMMKKAFFFTYIFIFLFIAMCLIFKLVVETTQCDIIVLQLWVNDQSTKYWPLHHFNPSSLIYVIKLPTFFTRWFGKYIYCSICRWKRLAMSVFSDYCNRLFFIPFFFFFFFCNYLKSLSW